jgi:cell division septum initiation protein DivIVA
MLHSVCGSDVETMRGRAAILETQRAEASRLRQRIAELEEQLITHASAKGSRAMYEIGHEIRTQKDCLHRIEECLAGLQSAKRHPPAEVPVAKPPPTP